MYKIEPVIMNYAWGSPDAVKRLFAVPNESGEPRAEFWYGAHPRGPSRLEDGSDLLDVISSRPEQMLGANLADRYSGTLPFLFKILSAKDGLSIQAHPSLEQAREGFSREDRSGIARDAPNRNYRDPNHKPECMVAIEEFWALSGFRKPLDIVSGLQRITGSELASDLITILSDQGSLTLGNFYRRLMTAPKQEQQTLLAGAVGLSAGELPDLEQGHDARWYWVGELARQFPDDPGALAPLYLNVLKLEPGQGLYMGAGLLHAYLRGTGFEIMANSDNVLRGGCTQKHVDVPELLKVLNFTDEDPQLVSPDTDGWYESGTAEFQLAWKDLSATAGLELRKEGGLGSRPAILVCRSGSIRLSAGETTAELAPSQAVYLPASEGEVYVSGDGIESSFALATVNR